MTTTAPLYFNHYRHSVTAGGRSNSVRHDTTRRWLIRCDTAHGGRRQAYKACLSHHGERPTRHFLRHSGCVTRVLLVLLGVVIACGAVLVEVNIHRSDGFYAEALVAPEALRLDPRRFPMTAASLVQASPTQLGGDTTIEPIDFTTLLVVKGQGDTPSDALDRVARRADVAVAQLNRSGRGEFVRLGPSLTKIRQRSAAHRLIMGGIGLSGFLVGVSLTRRWWRVRRSQDWELSVV